MSSLVSKVTSDDTQPIPMYTLKELAELTQKSVKDCESVRSALLSRLGKSSPDIKFKALRSIKYICAHGRVDFKLAFQRDNSVVKTLLQFSCPPDDLRGEKPAENVRAEAQECMEAIYADNQASAGSGIKVESMGNNMAAHYQSSQQQRGTSTYQGFGTAPSPKVEESITGFNIRKTISSAILGSGSSPPNHTPPTQSKYGGLSSNSYSQSSYSHYTHNPSAQPQQPQQQQQPQQPQPQQQNNNGVYSGQGFSPNGVFGGSGSSEAYAAAQAHGYETYNSSQNPYSSHQQSNAAGLNKTGPWGSKAGNAANSFNQPQNQQHAESFHHQPPHTQTQRSIPNQPYTSRTGPTTKDSVEDLAFEKRIVAQYTANTPLKPNLTDVELKKFTTESSACAVDDILTILYNTFSNATSQPSTLNKAVQIYSHLIVACGMTADECDADHINFIHQLYETTSNKHTKGHCEKMLAALELIQVSDSTRTSQQVSGFVAQPQPVQEQTFQQPQQQQQQQQQQGGNNVGGGDVFDFLSGQSQPIQTQQSDDLSSSFGFMNVDEQPQQTSAGAKKPMFSGLQVKPKTQQQQQQQQQGSGSAFDFLDAPAPQQQQTAQSNDLFALLGTSQTPQPKGGLDLDSLYAASAQTTTQQPKQQDMFAAMQPAPPQQQQQHHHQQQRQQHQESSFDFMTSDNTSNKHNDDVFGDLLSSPQRSQQPNPPPQQPAVNNTNSFDFVDAMF